MKNNKAYKGEAKSFLIQSLKRKKWPLKICVHWPFAVNSDGYGRVNWDGVNSHVSRLICESFHGAALDKKMQVAHSCGERSCINPRHLRWATKKENEADKKIHGTVGAARGENNASSKLKPLDIFAIRKAKGREFLKITAKRFGVHLSVVSKIQRGALWRSIK